MVLRRFDVYAYFKLKDPKVLAENFTKCIFYDPQHNTKIYLKSIGIHFNIIHMGECGNVTDCEKDSLNSSSELLSNSEYLLLK